MGDINGATLLNYSFNIAFKINIIKTIIFSIGIKCFSLLLCRNCEKFFMFDVHFLISHRIMFYFEIKIQMLYDLYFLFAFLLMFVNNFNFYHNQKLSENKHFWNSISYLYFFWWGLLTRNLNLRKFLDDNSGSSMNANSPQKEAIYFQRLTRLELSFRASLL